MRRRFQTMFAPSGSEPIAALPLGRSLPSWLIGLVAALACLWLARLDTVWLLPAFLAAAALALRAGRDAAWLWWVPAAVVAASALDVVAPLAASSRWGNLRHTELLAIGLLVIGLVRGFVWNETQRIQTRADRPMAALLALFAASLLAPGSTAEPMLLARQALTTAVFFFATVAIANRGGARWAWLVFPAVAGMGGLFATWAAFRDPKGVVTTLANVDAAWRTTGGLWLALMVAVPLGYGLAMKANPPALRHLCTVLVNLGVMGAIALVFAGARPFARTSVPDNLGDILRAVLLALALAGLAAHAEWNRRTQPEPARWLALTLTFSVAAAAVLAGMPIGGPVSLLLAIAGGLVVGVPRGAPNEQRAGIEPVRVQPIAAVPAPVRGTAAATPGRTEGAVPVPVRFATPPILGVPPQPTSRALPASHPRIISAQGPVRIPQSVAPAAAAPVQIPEPALPAAADADPSPTGEFHPHSLISVVIVAHRALGPLGACLSSLAAARLSVPMEVVVVDNDSCDGTLDWIRREHPWVGTIASSTNVGFARGVNLGVTEACGDLLLLLNPHCEVSAEALEAMCDVAARNPGLAAVAPMLLDGRGRLTRSCGRFPDLWTLMCDHFGLSQAFPRSRWFAGYQYGDRPLDSLQRVDWASAACLLIPRATWDAVGALDESMFLYLEEVDWSRRAARIGHQVRFVPAARIVHHGSLPLRPVPGDSYPDDLRSSVLYFRKHYGPVMAAFAKSILVTSLAFKWGMSSMRVNSRPLAMVYARGVTTVWSA